MFLIRFVWFLLLCLKSLLVVLLVVVFNSVCMFSNIIS